MSAPTSSRNLSLVKHKQLGSGAAGAVYKGLWGTRVAAFKMFHVSESESQHEAIQNEIRVMQTLKDKHIIQFYDIAYYEDKLVVIMEYARRGSLKDILDKKPPLEWDDKARIAHEVARGLDYMHGLNILHRDLKSANVLLTQHMEVKLCDFGLSEIRTMSITKSTDSFRGTPRWMAPELLSARPVYSVKSDIYALGMVMWEMAANCSRPFKDQIVDTVVCSLILSGEREAVPDNTPSEYREWMERCWDQDAANRPVAKEVILIKDSATDSDEGGSPISLGSNSDHTDKHTEDNADEEEDDDQMMPISAPTSAHPDSDASGWSSESFGSIRKALTFGLVVTTGIISSVSSADHGKGSPSPRRPSGGSLARRRRSSDDLVELIPRAENGDMDAQIELAAMYAMGEGVKQSHSQAFQWLHRAAELGNVQAQHKIGHHFFYGRGTRKSYTEARLWYLKAAEQGYAAAQNDLGSIYRNGLGLKRDYDEALAWYLKAAEQGHSGAQNQLGRMYQDGRGVEADLAQAEAWFNKAAEQGEASAQSSLGAIYLFDRETEEDYAKALALLSNAANQGNKDAQFNLGWMYEHGLGVDMDVEQAVQWYSKAAAQAKEEALERLAYLEVV